MFWAKIHAFYAVLKKRNCIIVEQVLSYLRYEYHLL